MTRFKKFFRYALFITPVILILLLGIFTYIVYLLSLELDSKFYQPVDSIPTKVFSRIFWLRPGQLLSLPELEERLAARNYQKASSQSQLNPGTYRIVPFTSAAANESWQEIQIYLNEFTYPKSVAQLFFDEKNIGIEPNTYFSILWHDGEIRQVLQNIAGVERELEGVALEPLLIAQLNRNETEMRQTVKLEEIPYTLLQAIVIVEDQRFLEHVGIDPRGILRSIWVNLRTGSYSQGASTITQQLIRNIYLSRSKTIKRKLKEMIMAILLELRYSKDEILAKYFNEVYFGQLGNLEIHGVSQAARHYFNKSLGQLTIAEQALLAAIVRGPFYYSPFSQFERAKKRQELVLKRMLEENLITQEAYQQAMHTELHLFTSDHTMNRSPYFTDFIKAQLFREIPDEELVGLGYQIFSTLDPYYQSLVEDKVKQGVERTEKQIKATILAYNNHQKATKKIDLETLPDLQGVFLLLDPRTNHLLAIVGGRSFKDSNYNRALYMQRQVGSIVKPFVYLAGLMYGANEDGTPLNAVSKLLDAPFKYEYDNQVWEPSNYEKEFKGEVTLRYSLANSINIPTARLAVGLGIDRVAQVIRAAGIETSFDILPSLALGAIEVPPIEIATAYSTLANFGYRREVTSILAITDQSGEPVAQFLPVEEQVLPMPEVANVVDMMRSVFTIGTAKSAAKYNYHYPSVGKTGTTNSYRDSWFAGFTSRLLAVAWIGFDRDSDEVVKLRNVVQMTGASAALPTWISVMKEAHKAIPEQDIVPPDPSVLQRLQVDILSGKRVTADCKGANIIEEMFTYRNAPQVEYECPEDKSI